MLFVVIVGCVLLGIGLYWVNGYFTGRSYYWQEQGDRSKSDGMQKVAFLFRWLIGADVLGLIIFLMASLGR
jgi:hypothetical protein